MIRMRALAPTGAGARRPWFSVFAATAMIAASGWLGDASAQFSQQGSALLGANSAGNAEQGTSVALSADGNTLLVGGSGDNSFAGAIWVYTRSNGVWTQQGSKLVGSGAYNGRDGAEQGFSVALSADGNTAVEGAVFD